ncbi:MAG TPA: alpha/beta hydrolase [Mycobacteriales bacterium]|nr:alpha/beta hydrolase [Mycobacteriales bacterium]
MDTEAMDSVELSQGTITYRAAGPADSAHPPVVFVHGILVDNQLWTAVADKLAEGGYRSYAPNLPLGSHRQAMKPDADLSPRGVAGMINDFMAKLGLTNVTLVGNDTGGALCQFLIDTDHSRIGRLVLTNCDAFDVFPPRDFKPLFIAAKRQALIKPLAASIKPTALRHSRLGYGLLFARKPDPAITSSWITPALTDTQVRRDIAKLMRAIHPKDLLDVSTRLKAFDKPVRIVWGAADTSFRLSLGERLAATFPHAKLTHIEGGKTFVSMEFPDEVAEAIGEAS